MTKFKKGNIVLCKKYEVSHKIVADKNGVRTENYIDDYFFNREAVIEYAYRDCMLRHGSANPEDKDEYCIRFLDDNDTLSWVGADELVLKTSKDNAFGFVDTKKESVNGKITIEDIVKEIAKRTKQELEVNNMPVEEFHVKVDRVADFLKSEIRICEERLSKEPSPYYDGVNVGFTNSQELNINHIRFCKKLLEMMNFK